jgi:hypothetical protein
MRKFSIRKLREIVKSCKRTPVPEPFPEAIVGIDEANDRWLQKFPVLTDRLNARANNWEYIPISMIDIPADEGRRLQKAIGEWSGVDTAQCLYFRFLQSQIGSAKK